MLGLSSFSLLCIVHSGALLASASDAPDNLGISAFDHLPHAFSTDRRTTITLGTANTPKRLVNVRQILQTALKTP
jgi:hypothetical protein